MFYGHRAGQLADPFGYFWTVSTPIENLSAPEIQRRFDAMPHHQESAKGRAEVRKGFHTVTPYIVAQNVPSLIEFLQKTFHAEETLRSGPGSEGGMHCEVRIGDSMLMVGGGGAGFAWKGVPRPCAFHIYVPDCDATYERALRSRRCVAGQARRSILRGALGECEGRSREPLVHRHLQGRRLQVGPGRRPSSLLCIRCGRSR